MLIGVLGLLLCVGSTATVGLAAEQEPTTPQSEPVKGDAADKPSESVDEAPPRPRPARRRPQDRTLNPELMLFESIPTVVTASRQPQSAHLASAAISIVTYDDIHYGGYNNVPDMLQFVPGVDVLNIDRNNAAVGVRGLHHPFSDRTLLLIDGRDATNPVYGGSDFFALPIFPEDIERIEVVRGPGGAAWGANAFNGVINIIQKDPKDVQGVLATTTISEFGDTFSHVRWADQEGDLAWRVSTGYHNIDFMRYPLVSDDTFPFPGTFDVDEFARDWRFNTELVHEGLDGDKLRFGGAYMHIERSNFEFVGFPIEALGDMDSDERIDLANLYARLERELSDGGTAYLQWFGRYEDSSRPSFWDHRFFENDVEGQFNFAEWGEHRVSLGGNLRAVHIETERARPTDLLPTATVNEYWAGFFAIDTWSLTDRLTIESQIRGDYYSETHADWSGRVAAIYKLDADERHILRAAAAKAFRAPAMFLRELDGSRIEIPPGSGVTLLNFTPPDDLDNEQIYSFEGGYTWVIAKGVEFKADGYYQIYEDLIGAREIPGTGPIGAIQTANLDGGRAFGAETSLNYRVDNVVFSAWYAYNDFMPDRSDQIIRAFQPAHHKAGVSGRLFLPQGWTANANYKFVDTTLNDPGTGGEPDIGSFHRLDLAVAKSLADGSAEIMVGVHDVLDETDFTVFPTGSFTGHEGIGQTFFLRVQLKF